MLRSFNIIHSILFLQVFAVLTGCSAQKPMHNPEGYDLNKPEIYFLPTDLAEISGIDFKQDQIDSIYAVEDENGRVYHLRPGSKVSAHIKFAGKGDYEDIAVCNNYVVILRSDGMLITFPVSELQYEKVDSVQQFKGLLPKGEFESLYADKKTGQLYILCKDCKDDKQNKECSGFIFQLQEDGTIVPSGGFNIPGKEIGKLAGEKQLSFRPSGFSKHPLTQDWYIISSIHKMLVVAGPDWRIKNVYPLNPLHFNQPEGITFDYTGNLYISNESSDRDKARIVRLNINTMNN